MSLVLAWPGSGENSLFQDLQIVKVQIYKARSAALSHLALSAGLLSLLLALLATALPSVRAAFGTAYGALVWAIADEGVTPALGLSRDPRDLSLGVHVYSLCGHGVFGATLEAVSRCADSITTS